MVGYKWTRRMNPHGMPAIIALRRAKVGSSASAVQPASLGIHYDAAFRWLATVGIVRELADGRVFLNEHAAGSYERQLQFRSGAMWVGGAFLLLVVLLLFSQLAQKWLAHGHP